MIKEGQTGEVPEETGGRGGLMIDFIIYENRMPSNDKTIQHIRVLSLYARLCPF